MLGTARVHQLFIIVRPSLRVIVTWIQTSVFVASQWVGSVYTKKALQGFPLIDYCRCTVTTEYSWFLSVVYHAFLTCINLGLMWWWVVLDPLEREVEPGGGGGTPLYKVYRYVPPQRVTMVFEPFWSENGYRFWQLRSEIGSGFWGGEHLRKLTNIFFFSVRNWND